jgi:hypothetical protein
MVARLESLAYGDGEGKNGRARRPTYAGAG